MKSSNWKLPVILIAILCYLQYGLWFGKNNYLEYQANKEILTALKHENVQLQTRNAQMIAELESLMSGKEAIEERAINELNMIYPDREFFRIIDHRPNKGEHR